MLVALAAVAVMLAVRHVAPPGGLYGATRGIGVFSAIEGSLGILIAFMIFLAFQSYLGARSAAQDEATRGAAALPYRGALPASLRGR